MAESIYSNSGDSIAKINNYDEAVRRGQQWKTTKKIDDELVVAKGPNDKYYAIFYVKDSLPTDHDSHPTDYEYKKRI